MRLLKPYQINFLQKEGLTQKKIGSIYQKTDRTIRRWKKWTYKKKQIVGRKPKIYLNDFISLMSHVFQGNNLTQQEMADYIYQKTGQKVSQQTISRTLKKYDITHKKINYHYADQLKHVDKVEKFLEMVSALSQSPTLAIDECSFHLNEVPRYAYSQKGQRANSRKPAQKGDNHSLILCIKNTAGQGIIHWELIQGGMKTKNFHEFISSLDLPADKKHYLLLDNLKVHHAKQSCQKLGLTPIKELLASKNIEPEYLPPYSPELNPVELCFNFLRKNTENKKPRTTEELKASIGKTIELLQQEDLTKYFRHCWDYFAKEEKSSSRVVNAKYSYWPQLVRLFKYRVRSHPNSRWRTNFKNVLLWNIKKIKKSGH